MTYKILLFILFSIPIIKISWKSLSNPRSHGFFRFFAFEAILLMILANLAYWFSNPYSPRQIVSWLLFLTSIVLAYQGFYLLRSHGKPKGSFEDTTELVTKGIYKYIRHPLYSSLLCLSAGIFLKNPSVVNTAYVIAITAFLIATAQTEEAENIQSFGPPYVEYMQRTKMFIPYIF